MAFTKLAPDIEVSGRQTYPAGRAAWPGRHRGHEDRYEVYPWLWWKGLYVSWIGIKAWSRTQSRGQRLGFTIKHPNVKEVASQRDITLGKQERSLTWWQCEGYDMDQMLSRRQYIRTTNGQDEGTLLLRSRGWKVACCLVALEWWRSSRGLVWLHEETLNRITSVKMEQRLDWTGQ